MEKEIAIQSLIARMFSDTFMVSLFLYLALVRIDLSLEGFVSRAFNLNILLIVCILSGVGTVLLDTPPKEGEERPLPRRSWIYAGALSMLVGSLIYQILVLLTPWALIMALGGTSVVFLIFFAMIREYGK